MMQITHTSSYSELVAEVKICRESQEHHTHVLKLEENLRKLLIDFDSTSQFTSERPPKTKDIWRWI